MITCQCAEAMPTYAPQSSYLTPIPSANIERGVAPLDSLPADWWNWLWNNITLNEGRIVQFINSVFSEINSVLSAAGVTPSTASTTDLKTAIQKLATTVATSAVPGSVLSSTLSGKLRVIADGTASINDLGTPDQLETTSKEVVSAINEVLALAQGKAPTSHASSDTTYGVGTTQQYGHVKVTEGCGLAISCGTISLNAPGYNCVGTVTQICYNGAAYSPSDGVVDLGNAAPTSHASSDTTYGVGTTQQYGHVKVTEGCGLAISGGTISLNAPGYNCVGTVTQIRYNGAAYSPSGGVVDLGNSPSGFPGYGTAICPLNGDLRCASSAGASNLVARADHVHAMPSCIGCDCSCICLTRCEVGIRACNVCIHSKCRSLNIYTDNYNHLVIRPTNHSFYTVYIPSINEKLCNLRNMITYNCAVGAGFCLTGSCINGYVEGIQWDCAEVVHIAYRPKIASSCICSTTLSPPQATFCTYTMRGMLTLFP